MSTSQLPLSYKLSYVRGWIVSWDYVTFRHAGSVLLSLISSNGEVKGYSWPHVYSFVHSSASEPVYKTACALTIHAIGRYSPDVLKNQAKNVLPLAFLGMHEISEEEKEDKEEANLWTEVWQENVPGMLTEWNVWSRASCLVETNSVMKLSSFISLLFKRKGACCVCVCEMNSLPSTPHHLAFLPLLQCASKYNTSRQTQACLTVLLAHE